MEQRVPHRQHPARRMPEQDEPGDAELLQQGLRVRRQLLEAVLVALGLARLAEADLVGRDPRDLLVDHDHTSAVPASAIP